MRCRALAIVFVVGCSARPLPLGGSSTTTTGSTTTGSTTTGSTTTGSTTTGSTTSGSTTTGTTTSGSTTSGTTTSGSTTFGTSGSTTGTTSGASCDVAAQDCATGLKCIGQWDSQFTTLSGACVSDGTVSLGQSCNSSASTTFMYDDDCKKGLVCDDLYGNAPMQCRKICATDGDCADGGKCGDFSYGMAGWGWCASTCTPFSSAAANCPSGMDCAETVESVLQTDPSGLYDGFFFCKKTGTGGLLQPCQSDGECAAGLWCGAIDQNGDSGCIANCSDSVTCAQPNADAGITFTCYPWANTPAHAGYCSPF
jgi:hypothetical protein